MEFAWKWRDCAISIKVLSGRGESRADPGKENGIVESSSTHDWAEEARRENLLASGSRYVGRMT